MTKERAPVSPLQGSNTPYLEDMLATFRENPNAVSAEWRSFLTAAEAGEELNLPKRPSIGTVASAGVASANSSGHSAQNSVARLINAYRSYGHKWAHINPLHEKPALGADLSLETFGLSKENLEETFATDGMLISRPTATLQEILDVLQQTYTRSIGAQFRNLPTRDERVWLFNQMEACLNQPAYSAEKKVEIYQGLYQADAFEKFIHTKYVGMKRFSVEGGDALVPMLQRMVNMAGEQEVKDIVIGMAHRGRLNTLANVMGKPLEHIFASFEDSLKMKDSASSSGDVKYHAGRSYDITTQSGHILHISLLANPSHLEAVNPVVEGSVKAKQKRYGKGGEKKVIPLVIHGDAALAGQGIVPETLNLSQLDGFNTGGTIHVVINNRLGYTAEPHETFSGEYCTDIARMLQIPIFHVNGDDAEACVHTMEMAMKWRETFGRDVMIDLVCYRKYGHNEGDDPTFTQPEVYAKIKAHPSPAKVYKSRLAAETEISANTLKEVEEEYNQRLKTAYDKVHGKGITAEPDIFGGEWRGMKHKDAAPVQTNISKQTLMAISRAVSTYPTGFTPHPKVHKFMQQRSNMLAGKEPLNWGAAEVAAYASLLAEGYSVRLTGQDVQRGTFAHRHGTLVDNNTGWRTIPISTLARAKGGAEPEIEIYNSALSELAVVGFEYGYSLAAPKTLTVWEAQFGDFANGAQIIFDQFLSSSEHKWDRYSGLTLLLPHGLEGAGPEHSSCRLERFLQLCAQDNMVVCNATTPAQMFHLLRRQMLRKFRKPLIVATPKSLLRHPSATSTADQLTNGGFQEVIDDMAVKAANVKRVAICSGKIYYELLAYREENKNKNVALIRLEQLYPLAEKEIKVVLGAYKNAEICWVQEEPRNMGAWTFMLDNLSSLLEKPLKYIGRAAYASPAVGSPKRHKEEQQKIIAEVFAIK